MKIAILTLPLHTNYGGILQAYALQTILERMGHEVYVIEKEIRITIPFYKMPFCYTKRIIKNIIGRKCSIFYEQKYLKEQSVIRQNTNKFIVKYIHLIKYKDYSNIKEGEYDAIVVGSDQVWRSKYYDIKQIEQVYLKFAENWNIKRIAYAASFGTDKWEYLPEQTKECKKLLKLFDAVSVREDAAVYLCRKYFKIEAQQVLDPTMLLDKEDYINLFKVDKTPKSKGNLLCYILDQTEEKNELIKRIVEEKKLNAFNVKSQSDNRNSPISERIQPPIEQWLRGFYDAEFVITDSFHACVFSILFNKPFIVYGNESRGMSRFNSLLSLFKLNETLITDISEYKGYIDFDWDNINRICREYRKLAHTFLLCLKNDKNE